MGCKQGNAQALMSDHKSHNVRRFLDVIILLTAGSWCKDAPFR